MEHHHGYDAEAYPTEWDVSPAVFDFRSDTLTTPTPAQLAALKHACLGDDVYGESRTTVTFENQMATILEKPAGLFVLTGTMGNQLSIRALLTQPPHSVLCDSRAHVVLYEAGGLATFSQAMVQSVTPRNGMYLTLEDIREHAVLDNDVHNAPTRVISLENTLGGNIFPLEEVQRIGAWARKNGVKMHLDGARLWNAVSVYDSVEKQLEVLQDYAKEFDTVTLCLSKSIGAPMGSIILGSEDIIARVRHLRKAMGGGIRQAGVLTAMANAAVQEVFWGGKLKETNEKAKRIANFWVQECGGKLSYPVETNMVWFDFKSRGIVNADVDFVEEGVKAGVRVAGWGRVVVHWQNSDEAIERLCKALKALVDKTDARIAAGETAKEIPVGGRRTGYGRK